MAGENLAPFLYALNSYNAFLIGNQQFPFYPEPSCLLGFRIKRELLIYLDNQMENC